MVEDHPDLALVQGLLEALDIAFDTTRLHEAEERVGRGPASAAQWLREVLVAAEIREATPVQIPWQRFDPRRLPVLLRHGDAWHLATDIQSDGVLLMSSDGSQSRFANAALDGAQVLWIRRPPTRSQDGVSPPENLAARLVWKALFAERGWLWQVAVATGLVNLLGISTGLFAMQVYDRVVPTMAYATLTTLVAGMALVVGLDWALKTIRARILDSLAGAVDQQVSGQVFEHLLQVQLDAQPRALGTLAAQVGSLDAVRQFFSATVVFALVDLPFALMFLGFIAVIGGAVAWVYVLLLPAALLLGFLTQRRLRNLVQAQLSRGNERQGLLVDSIRGCLLYTSDAADEDCLV